MVRVKDLHSGLPHNLKYIEKRGLHTTADDRMVATLTI